MSAEYSGKDDVSMLNDDQLARAEALRMARAVLEVRGMGGSYKNPGEIQPGKAYDITSMANWIITGQYGLTAVAPTSAIDYYGDGPTSSTRPQETVVERTEPDDDEPEQCPECNHLPHLPSACDPGCFCHHHHAAAAFSSGGIEWGPEVPIKRPIVDLGGPGSPHHVVLRPGDTLKYQPVSPEVRSEVHFEITEDEREHLNASGRSAWINVDAVNDNETPPAAPDQGEIP